MENYCSKCQASVKANCSAARTISLNSPCAIALVGRQRRFILIVSERFNSTQAKVSALAPTRFRAPSF